MIKRLSLIWFVLVVLLLLSCKSDSEKALEYNNQIVLIQDELTSEIDTFLQSVSYPEGNTAILFKSAQNTSELVLEKLKSIKQFEGGTALFLETQNYINVCKDALRNEGAEIVHIKAKLSLDYSKEELNGLYVVADSLLRKVNGAASKFDQVQMDFARKYRFKVKSQKCKME